MYPLDIPLEFHCRYQDQAVGLSEMKQTIGSLGVLLGPKLFSACSLKLHRRFLHNLTSRLNCPTVIIFLIAY